MKHVAHAAEYYVSASASFLQEEYAKLFKELCSEYSVPNPFALDDERMRKFFADISDRWKSRKQQLDEGK